MGLANCPHTPDRPELRLLLARDEFAHRRNQCFDPLAQVPIDLVHVPAHFFDVPIHFFDPLPQALVHFLDSPLRVAPKLPVLLALAVPLLGHSGSHVLNSIQPLVNGHNSHHTGPAPAKHPAINFPKSCRAFSSDFNWVYIHNVPLHNKKSSHAPALGVKTHVINRVFLTDNRRTAPYSGPPRTTASFGSR